MLTQVADYQLEWHPEDGPQCRYRLLGEAEWSGWVQLRTSDFPLVSLLLNQQPVFYNRLTGALGVGAAYAAEAAAPASRAAFAPDIRPVATPNSGDDEEATQELGQAAAWTAAAGAPRWRTGRSLLVLLDQVNRLYPHRNKASDGTIADSNHPGTSDHQPNILDAGIGVVTALDLTHDPAHGCDAQRLADALVASRDQRIKYVIWNRRIAHAAALGGTPAWAWRPYTGKNPHDHHLHLSVKAAKEAYDSGQLWQVS